MKKIYSKVKPDTLLHLVHRLDEIETYIQSQYTGEMFFEVLRLPKVLPFGKSYFP